MRGSPGNRRIYVLLESIRNGTLVPNPDFQRRLVWSNKHKSNFIDTVLRGYPFPEIYVATGEIDLDTGKGREMLVDGQQRLTTLKQYFDESQNLQLSDEITPYSKLETQQKHDFLDYEVVVRHLGQISITEIKDIFRRINSTGYSLNAMEIHNARFDGEIKQFAEELTKDPFFENRRIFRAAEIRRMRDIGFTLSVIITVMSTYFDRDSEFESYLSQYNDEFEKKASMGTEFQKVFRFISNCRLPQNSRAWRRKSDLFTLLVEIYRVLIKDNKPLKAVEVGKRLRQFYELVDDPRRKEEGIGSEHSRIVAYYNATQQGTNNRINRIDRGKILQDVINGKFEFDKEQN